MNMKKKVIQLCIRVLLEKSFFLLYVDPNFKHYLQNQRLWRVIGIAYN